MGVGDSECQPVFIKNMHYLVSVVNSMLLICYECPISGQVSLPNCRYFVVGLKFASGVRSNWASLSESGSCCFAMSI